MQRKRPTKVYWYASTPDIKWMGPYPSQIDGWLAVAGLDGLPVSQASVWCTDKRMP